MALHREIDRKKKREREKVRGVYFSVNFCTVRLILEVEE
jgi:hypothetical protein